ncbi:MAG: hypothetical protein N7Q72_02925, partial [Spiroplasma sp. Tabriz.8]|nr:hypothetical protein [Spiroplasma sp. Tabriz.8]
NALMYPLFIFVWYSTTCSRVLYIFFLLLVFCAHCLYLFIYLFIYFFLSFRIKLGATSGWPVWETNMWNFKS